MDTHPDLDALARRVIAGNRYLTLGTLDPGGAPRLSPVFYTAVGHRDFYWVSAPGSHHSRNLAARPSVALVIFDSTAAIGAGEAVYLSASARQVGDDELGPATAVAFATAKDGVRFTAGELRGDAELRLYVARATACDVHVPGSDPRHGSGIDARRPADPFGD